jgi:hypothetical protein
MQKKWFGVMYRIGAPFMRSPAKVAYRIGELIEKKILPMVRSTITRNRVRSIPQTITTAEARFWDECYRLIGKYLDI